MSPKNFISQIAAHSSTSVCGHILTGLNVTEKIEPVKSCVQGTVLRLVPLLENHKSCKVKKAENHEEKTERRHGNIFTI